jgi:hypothetical protein
MDPRLYHRPRIEWWQLRRRWRRWRDDLQHHAAPIRRSHWQSVVLAWMWGSLAIAPLVAIGCQLVIQRTDTESISVMGIVINALVAWPIVFGVAWLGALVVRAVQLFRWRRRARIETGRANQGLCPGCGHIVDRAGFSDRCPECGYFLHRR